MKKCVYAGTFDPITVGHSDIILKAMKLFDEVIVAVAENPEKKTMFDLETRFKMVRKSCEGLKNVKVVCHSGMLYELIKKENAVASVRGIRNVADLEYENSMAFYNAKLIPECITVYIPCEKNLEFVSSSAVRQLIKFGVDFKDFVPKGVEEIISKKQIKK